MSLEYSLSVWEDIRASVVTEIFWPSAWSPVEIDEKADEIYRSLRERGFLE